MAEVIRSAYERVQLARSKERPNIQDYIDHLFSLSSAATAPAWTMVPLWAALRCWATAR